MKHQLFSHLYTVSHVKAHPGHLSPTFDSHVKAHPQSLGPTFLLFRDILFRCYLGVLLWQLRTCDHCAI